MQERRTETRHPISATAFIHVAESAVSQLVGASIQCDIVNLSKSGIGFQNPKMIPKDTTVNVVISTIDTPLAVFTLAGEVRWVAGAQDLYTGGIEFHHTDELSDWQYRFRADLRRLNLDP